MKKKTFLFLIVAFFVCSGFNAKADGGYYPYMDDPDIFSGDQRAIIIQLGNTVSMTFSTAYSGEGDDFAWLIPTPTALAPSVVREIKDQGDSAFNSLDGISAPVFDYIYPSYDYESSGCGCYASETSRDLPAAGVMEYGVTVIGTIDTETYLGVVLAGDDAANIITWLTEHGFKINATAAEVLDYYVMAHWSFVVLKIKPSQYRRYESEYLAPVNIVYEAGLLQFPLRISASSSVRETHITMFVVADHTMKSANFPTAPLNYQSDLTIGNSFDRNKFLYNAVKTTLADGKGTALIYANEFVPDRQTQDLIPVPFKTSKKYYLTRLESYVFPAMMDEDIFIGPDSQDRPFSVRVTVRVAMSDDKRLAYLFPVSVFCAGLLRRKKGRFNKYAAAALLIMIALG